MNNDSLKKPPLNWQQKIDTYPEEVQKRLYFLRQLILDVAARTEGVGEIEETLKWGEPSFVTSQTKSGSTIRMDWKAATPDHYYLFFNCKTTLIDDFKQIYANTFKYEDNRSLVLDVKSEPATDALADCIAMALTYHQRKKAQAN